MAGARPFQEYAAVVCSGYKKKKKKTEHETEKAQGCVTLIHLGRGAQLNEKLHGEAKRCKRKATEGRGETMGGKNPG